MSAIFVFLTIFVTGLAGGVGGALLSNDFIVRNVDGNSALSFREQYKVEFLDWWVLFHRLVLGVLAAFVVPLFLVLAAPGKNEGVIENLMVTCPPVEAVSGAPDKDKNACPDVGEWWTNLFVLIGFCILAATIGQRFLGSMADRWFKDMEERVDKANRTSRAALKTAELMGPSQKLDAVQTEVLKAFLLVKTLPATLKQIAEKTKIESSEVADILADLSDTGFIKSDHENESDRLNKWRLRGWGMLRLRDETGGLSDKDIDVLQAIKNSTEKRPKIEHLVESSDFTKADLIPLLKKLERLGLIAPSSSESDGWRLHKWGKVALEEKTNK